MEIPVRVLKSALISICRDYHQRPIYGRGEPFAISVVNQQKQVIHTVKGIINIVRNAMSPTFFGANIIVENCEFILTSGTGMVEFRLVLPEVNDNAKISEQLVRINKVMPFEGSDINAFIHDVTHHIVQEWNR